MGHTLEVRADLFAALVHGVRFCETHGKGLGVIARAVRSGDGHVDTAEIVKRSDFESDSAFYDALAILFTLVKVLYLLYPCSFHEAMAMLSPGDGLSEPPWAAALRD